MGGCGWGAGDGGLRLVVVIGVRFELMYDEVQFVTVFFFFFLSFSVLG